MLHKVSKDSSKATKELKTKAKGGLSFEDQMLSFISENKRLLNIHKHKFPKLAAFQANTNVFQTNTNASLKNLETQVGQLALNMQNQSRDSFPSDTKKNPKECMEITLRSGKELENREEEKKKLTENQEKAETGKDSKLNSSEIIVESEKLEVQKEQQNREGKLKKKEEVRAYQPTISFAQRMQK